MPVCRLLPSRVASLTAVLFVLAIVCVPTAAQVCVAPPSGLVSWWTGDTGESDLYGVNNPSAVNAVTLVPGEVLDGFTFGAGGYIDIPAAPSLANQTFTWDAWVEPAGPGPNNDTYGSVIVQPGDNQSDGTALWWSALDNRFRFAFGNIYTELIVSNDTFPPGSFYLVAATYDGSTFRLYVNGELEGTYAETKTLSYSSETWEIGSTAAVFRAEGFPRTWNGIIDEVEAFNVALSAAQIQSIYNAGSAGKCKPAGNAGVQTAYVYFGNNASGVANNGFGTVSLTTGAYTQAGNTGTLLAGLAAGPGGTLYGVAGSTLYQINPGSGSLTPIGTSPISYLLFGSTTSGVYAVDESLNLYFVNTTTAAVTLIGPTGLTILSSGGWSGMSTGSSNLYVTVSSPINSPTIVYSINTTTGAGTEIGNTGVPNLGASVYENGVLYAGSGASSPYSIYTLDPTTGLATFVAATSGPFWGLAPTVTATSGPQINYVSPILPQEVQTIKIIGSGFGTYQPYTGDSAYIAIGDNNKAWQAGYLGNCITLQVNSWQDTEIDLGGFSGCWGSGNFTISAGDSMTVAIWNAQSGNGPAVFDTVATPLQSLQNPGSYSFTVVQNTQTSESIQFTNPGNASHTATLTILNPNSVPVVTLSSSNSVTVPPGQTQTVSLLVDSTSTPVATYNGIQVQASVDDGTTLYTTINVNVVQQDLPDLEVGVNDIQPPVVNPDLTVTLSANIHNLGTLGASNVTVEFLDYGTSLGETIINQLDPNATALASLTVPLASGNHLIQVLIDPANAIQESNKNNNEASQIVQIGSSPPPVSGDILVTGIIPSTVYTSSLFTVSGQAVYDLFVNGTEYTNYVVMGGSVSITITSPSNAGGPWVYGNVHTDINGNFSQTIAAPATAGTYNITIAVTDNTFIGTRELAFAVVVPPPPNQPPPTPAPPCWVGCGSGGTGGGYVYDPGSGTFNWCWTCDGGSGPPNFPVPSSNLWLYSSDITFSNDNPALNEEITLTAQVHYWASNSSLVAQNVPINFLVTYPGLPQIKVGQTVIPSISVLGPDYGSSYTFANWRNLAEGIYIVEVQIDPSYVEQDTLDNAATRAIIVGQALPSQQGAVSGHVTGPLGGLANVTVSVVDSTGTSLGNTVTDQTGFYLMSNVPVGQTQVTIVPPTGYVTSTPTQTVAVSDQQVADLDFSLTATSTITTLTSSVNPANINQKVTYTATVTPAAGSTATGTISFQDGSVTIATVKLSSSVATYATSYKSIGSHSITAIYSGDANNQGSTSAALTEQIKATSKTVTMTSGSPSTIGQSVTFTATVSSTSGSIPNGETVTFYDGSMEIGTGTTAQGTATFATSLLSVKTHTIKATYIGDTSFDLSSGTVKQIVNAFTTSTTLTASPNPSNFGQSVLLTAVVSTTGSNPPTGKVTFKNGTTTLGTSTMDSTGTATLNTTKLPLGPDSITASYGGDPLNGKSTSSEFTQTVNPAEISMTLTSSPNPSTSGKSVKFTATLTSDGSLPNGQTVTFSYNGSTFGTATISGGKASFSYTSLPSGSDQVTATYAVSADYDSASASVTQQVN